MRIAVAAALIAILALVGLGQGVRAAGAFIDEPDGYALTAPDAGWSFDGSLLPDVARWNSQNASIRIYMQPVADAAAAATYIAYSNRSVDEQWNGIQLQQSTQTGDTWFRQWLRPAMPLMQPDMRQYAEWDEIFSPTQVFTVMVNATPDAFPAAFIAAERMFASAAPAPMVGSNAFNIAHDGSRPAPLLPPSGMPVQWGLFEPKLNVQKPGDLAPVLSREAQLGRSLPLVMVYVGFDKPFPAELIKQAAAQGQIVELTLQSWAPTSEGDRSQPYTNGTSQDAAILSGQDDAALQQFAQAAAATGLPFFLRLDNEMNGDWDPWSAFQWGKDTDIYTAVWKHVYGIFQQAGATNAVWIWNPNNDNLPAYRWNDAPLYYPGDQYVDWVGLTAYNLGTGQDGSAWRSFTDAFGPAYASDQRLFPTKPLIITEFASNDQGGDKAAWIQDMFAALPQFPAIRYAVWWDANQGALDYALNQPPAALDAFRAGLQASGQ
ncbi:MAG TPA: glycosyl hydrolase [Bacillota bacterium]|nr:glycosyl hydrolase [Bacillota bacterium]